MASHGSPEVSLRRWSDGDLVVLERSNTPEMTAFLGGPESAKQLGRRHGNFLRYWDTGEASMFVVVESVDGAAVGSIGYWNTEFDGSEQYETGWSIHSEYQGRGIASTALRLCLRHAAENGGRRLVVAFPRIDNAASNSLCRRVGFDLVDERDFEYPMGNPIRVKTWAYDLRGTTTPESS